MEDDSLTQPVLPPPQFSGRDDVITDSQMRKLLGEILPGTQSPLTQGRTLWQPPTVEQLQQALPQYEISALIARGGMGAVYKGVQKTLRRPVAIKVLPPEIEDHDLQFAARFKLEAQAMAQLGHPNIVAVFDAGETPDGLLYFVMEFIEGTDLAQIILSEGRLEPARAVPIITAVCEALAFAHEEGIIHRDIKPANVMIDKRGRVKVADFGLAKKVNIEPSLMTHSNVAMGTPDFIAPEALMGGMKVDQRADIYAVGVMLYQVLTGMVPRGRFALPSGVVPQVDRGFDTIVDKAMQTDREQRYNTATELKQALENVAIKPAVPALPALPVRKSRLSWYAAAASFLGLAGAGLWLLPSPSTDAPVVESAAKAQWMPLYRDKSSLEGLLHHPARLYANIAEVPELLDSPELGVTFDQGWIKPSVTPKSVLKLYVPKATNVGVRLRSVLRSEAEAIAISLRGDSNGEYQLNRGNVILYPRNNQKPERLANFSSPVALGQEYSLEFYAVGERLLARRNDRWLMTSHALLKGKECFYIGSAAVRDVEFINLDGLSEAEALKLIGAPPQP